VSVVLRHALLTAGVFCAIAVLRGPAPVWADDSVRPYALANQPIHRDPAIPAAGQRSASPVESRGSGFDPVRVTLALAGVVGLILMLRLGMRRLFPGDIALRSTRAIQVLSRCTISPRQHLLLIRVGKRLIVVGDSGTQLNPLCEIADGNEIEALLAQVHEDSAAATHRFELFFGKARKGYEPELSEAEAKVPPADAAFDPTHELIDPSLSQTRKELSGLSEKVRDLARQMGRA